MLRFIILSILSLFVSCIGGGNSSSSGSSLGEEVEFTKYAKGLSVKEYEGIKLVEITDPIGKSSTTYKYALIPRESRDAKAPNGYSPIKVPIEKVICMTTLQLSGFIKLGVTDNIVGITSTRFLQNESMNERLQRGDLARIGIEGEFDTEVVLSLEPDLIFVSPFKRGGYDAVDNLGIPMLAYLGYKEPSPLGQAEWVKLIGVLLGREREANSCFNEIEKEYLKLKKLVADVKDRPKVLSGEMHSGNWYVVGGESALAQLFRDAGGEYFMHNDDESGGFYVDYETVYSQGYDADFWRIVNSFDGEYSYKDLLAADGRYQDFAPFKKRQVIYCNLREGPFYENTPMEPEVVLADLIKAFHPTLLPDYEAQYYKVMR
ncbi:MAG: ABC transporter substrate-binding protein [Rikenellaceae bacterium]